MPQRLWGVRQPDVAGLVRVKRHRFEDGRAVFVYIMDPTDPTHRVVDATSNTKLGSGISRG